MDQIKPLVLTSPSGGQVVVETPVVLAPMAGVTNAAFRTLCREQGAGLYVCEMITSRGLVAGDRKTDAMLTFFDSETIRSVQTYGTDPQVLARAVDMLCTRYRADHVDLNFGCPVPKVTRKGGGGVLPWKLDLFGAIVDSAVRAADRHRVPVTVKLRIGLDEDHETYLDAGRIAEQAGAAAICLHARTVEQAYSGHAHWDAIARLVEEVDVPVLGNGDIWEPADALAMISRTGCAGVEVGRGCLGRPWLFRDLAAALHGQPVRTVPNLGEVAATVRRHGELLALQMGEKHGLTDLRKHMSWYFKGFPVGGELRHGLGLVDSFESLDALLATVVDKAGAECPYPERELGRPRGRQGSPRHKVVMPYGWLDDRCGLQLDLADAEVAVSGG
ncbi:putative TIM-barrel protein, nifR3 family [Propionibacterium cyclohexanicum]|uniref:tRNA-dihydrouridine synthase n=1 Tax=Propionibacterium cyclohexanicum TaxID=64702 RepID=A0A1H9Q5T3_9ACTN|nr:tRNA dihydrouridine synthase DusB [Propionibacterium cyclohexanicum]SER55778.1 putative TIM-barrel protein, nifR3 family [Propionibacterium cyclohexanicum]